MKSILSFVAFFLTFISASAQIGYQVALLNQSTGEPRANETVQVTIAISDNSGKTICSETKSATTNGAGILSLEIGNASTFNDTDWTKLPLWVSATIGDITIGRTQILSVPVAEYAKQTDCLDKRKIMGKQWSFNDTDTACSGTLSFSSSIAKISATWTDDYGGFSKSSPYVISGYTIICAFGVFAYDKSSGNIIGIADDVKIVAH